MTKQTQNVLSLFLSLTCLSVVACTPKEGYVVDSYHEQKIEDLAEEVKIPSKAWDILEGKSTAAHGSSEEQSPEASSVLAKEFVFSEVTVFLVEKNPGVLKRPAYKISLPRGGGEIDLDHYMGISPGSFFVGFEYPEFVDAQDKKVLFVSQAKKRKIDDIVYGLGCNQFVDITSKFFEAMKREGLKVNTTRDRHLSVLGGHFLFSAQKNNTVYVSQVSFTDSNKTNLFCEAP
ncbi:hypothetical protein D3C87_174950 [compost metagenome]